MAQRDWLPGIREELKRTVRLLLDQVCREHPTDHFYAILFEVGVTGTYATRIAGSEEVLTRLAEKYIKRGYRVASGDVLETLRTALRWDAPGDDRDGWYWGDQKDDLRVTKLIEKAVAAGQIVEYGEDNVLRRLCVETLRELSEEAAFGKGTERERILIGITFCEVGGILEEDIPELKTLNPPATVRRFRKELAASTAAFSRLIRPTARGK